MRFPMFTIRDMVRAHKLLLDHLGVEHLVVVAGISMGGYQALELITIGAARTLHLDTEIGSISPGKRADFAVLGRDPLDTSPADLADIPVLGTVFGGRLNLL